MSIVSLEPVSIKAIRGLGGYTRPRHLKLVHHPLHPRRHPQLDEPHSGPHWTIWLSLLDSLSSCCKIEALEPLATTSAIVGGTIEVAYLFS